jgi:hypothetical protein
MGGPDRPQFHHPLRQRRQPRPCAVHISFIQQHARASYAGNDVVRTLPQELGIEFAGLAPFALAPKEGLACINGTQAQTALLALLAHDARVLWRTAEGVGDYQPAGAPLPGGGFVIDIAAARRPPAIVAASDGGERELATQRRPRRGATHPGRPSADLDRTGRVAMTACSARRATARSLIPLTHGGPVGATTDGCIGTQALRSRGYAL